MTDDAPQPEEELNPKKRGLGRGLDALFADEEDQGEAGVSRETGQVSAGNAPQTLSVADIHPSKFQPRRAFDPETLDELASSIERHGVLQPLVVREDPSKPGSYELIAGERRWRAAQKIQLHEVPVIIKTLTDLDAIEIALIENLQREDLNPIEEALGYQRLCDEFDYSQSDLAKHLGKSRPHVVNTMRLLNLPTAVQEMVVLGALSAGHARTLVGKDNAEELAHKIVEENLSVRAAEALHKEDKPTSRQSDKSKSESKTPKGPDTIALENEMSLRLGMKLEIIGLTDGKIVIHYKDLDQLDDVMRRLSGMPAKE